MIIASDTPTPSADVSIEVTNQFGTHERATLVYETWRRDERTGKVIIRCYDAQGAAVNIFLSQEVVEECVFGETLHVHTP